MKTEDASATAAAGPVERMVGPLVERLRDEAGLCRNEGATDIAALLDEAAEEMHNLAWALSLPGFDRMATDAQEAEHQAGARRVNDTLARMEKAKAEHEDAMKRADAHRWLRGGPDVPQDSLRWPRWEVRRWDGQCWQTLFAEQLDAHLAADMERERHNKSSTAPASSAHKDWLSGITC